MAERFCCRSNSFVLLKCLHPKKPLSALKGDGWAAFNTKCLLVSKSTCLSCANLPHNKKIIPFLCSDILRITASVKFIQPHLAWLAGSLALTVSTAFKSSTPCSAHWVRLPVLGRGAMHEERVQARIAGQHLPAAARRGVALEDAIDVFSQASEHGSGALVGVGRV